MGLCSVPNPLIGRRAAESEAIIDEKCENFSFRDRGSTFLKAHRDAPLQGAHGGGGVDNFVLSSQRRSLRPYL